MDFSPKLLAAAERELALLSAGKDPVELDENEFDQELLQNAANELERIPSEEFRNLGQRDREEFRAG